MKQQDSRTVRAGSTPSSRAASATYADPAHAFRAVHSSSCTAPYRCRELSFTSGLYYAANPAQWS